MINITSTLINPRVDIAFKKIFGVEENKDILNFFAKLYCFRRGSNR